MDSFGIAIGNGLSTRIVRAICCAFAVSRDSWEAMAALRMWERWHDVRSGTLTGYLDGHHFTHWHRYSDGAWSDFEEIHDAAQEWLERNPTQGV